MSINTDLYIDTPLGDALIYLSATPFWTMPIAGIQYHEVGEYDECLGTIIPALGDRLELVREPDNHYDENAIKVMWRNGQHHIGYIPRTIASYIAQIMDSGSLIESYILISSEQNWGIHIILYNKLFEENKGWKLDKEYSSNRSTELTKCYINDQVDSFTHSEWIYSQYTSWRYRHHTLTNNQSVELQRVYHRQRRDDINAAFGLEEDEYPW